MTRSLFGGGSSLWSTLPWAMWLGHRIQWSWAMWLGHRISHTEGHIGTFSGDLPNLGHGVSSVYEHLGGQCDRDCCPQAPDWVDAEECHRCRVQFGVVTRKVSIPQRLGCLVPCPCHLYKKQCSCVILSLCSNLMVLEPHSAQNYVVLGAGAWCLASMMLSICLMGRVQLHLGDVNILSLESRSL